jgi:hypothetical protein
MIYDVIHRRTSLRTILAPPGPIIVCVLPLPVCPYAKHVAVYLDMTIEHDVVHRGDVSLPVDSHVD